MANRQRQSLINYKHFCLNSQLEILRKTGVFPSFESSCGSVDFPRPSLLVASLPCRPIPALRAHSLCSTPQRKCQVWPQEVAQHIQDKEIFRLSPPPPTHHDDQCALPACNKQQQMHPQRLSHSSATRRMSQFFSAGVCQPADGR